MCSLLSHTRPYVETTVQENVYTKNNNNNNGKDDDDDNDNANDDV